MISGRNALSEIDQALADIRREETALNKNLSAASDDITRLQAEQTDAYEDLARFRLDDETGTALAGRLNAAGRRAKQLLAEREEALHLLVKNRERIERDLEKLAEIRAKRGETLDAASGQLETAMAKAEERLAGDDAWAEQRKVVEAAQKMLEAAEQKATTAESDRDEKGKPYRDDPLFMYLWERQFGTSSYRAGNIVRMLDRWVAGLVRFHEARANYAVLTEIPVRLREHVNKVKEKLAEETEKLHALEKTAVEAEGGSGLDKEIAKIRTEINAFDKRYQELSAELERSREDEAKYAEGQDIYFKDAIAALGQSLQSQDLKNLWKEAFATPSPEDERILERIEDANKRIRDIENSVGDDRQRLKQLSKRREELTRITTDFRRHHYDEYGSEFADDAIVGKVLKDFLGGSMSGGDYWRRIERGYQQRPRRRARHGGPVIMGDFGSFPGFPSGGNRNGGPFGPGGNDGFSSGDSFGGDGFHTGDTF